MSDQLPIDYNAILRRAEAGAISQLTDREEAVLSLLPRGRENTISKDAIAAATGIHWREVQSIIEHLVNVHGYFIGSTSGKPHGYYMIEAEKEIEEVYNSLRRRGLKVLMRAAKLKKISVEEVFNQGRIDLSGGNHGIQ